jgi:hypothetical protein
MMILFRRRCTSSACATSIPSTEACAGPPLQSQCAVTCMADSDCGALGPTGVCTAGLCRRPLVVTTTNGHVLTCAERSADIKAKLDPVVASADRSCMTDADCIPATLWNACFSDGCNWVSVSRVGAVSIAAELDTLRTHECDAAFKAGCAEARGFSCPTGSPIACVSGACQGGNP